ncbi:MAG: hypothetical protein ACREKL_08585 [Chthoniobacterales bacterium]
MAENPIFLYNILPAERMIVVRFRGEITEDDVIEASRMICSDTRYRHGFDGLIDLAEITNAVTPAHIEELVEYSLSKRKHGHGKWAVIVSTPAATAYAMIYQKKVADKHPFAIFCSFEGAAEFLKKPVDSIWLDANLTPATTARNA